jgi:hypothetical protein
LAKGVVFGGLNVGGGSNIKSIQSGELTLSGITTSTVNISTIDPTKSIIRVFCSSSSNYLRANKAMGEILNSTQIKFTRGGTDSDLTIYWEVIEFSKVKSLQKGSLAGNANVTIASVDISKTLIFSSEFFASAVTNLDSSLANPFYKLTNPTTLTRYRGFVNSTVHYQVVVFD